MTLIRKHQNPWGVAALACAIVEGQDRREALACASIVHAWAGRCE